MLDLASGAAKRSKSSKKGKRPLSSSNTPKHPRLLRDEGKVLLFLYLGKGWYCIACILQSTVEPRLTTTPLLRPLFYAPNKSPLIFLSENPVITTTPLLRPPTTFGSPESLFSLQNYPVNTTSQNAWWGC